MWYHPGLMSSALGVLIVGQGLLACYRSSCRCRTAFALGPDTLFIALLTGFAITSALGLAALSVGRFTVSVLLGAHGAVFLFLLAGVARAGLQPLSLSRARRGIREWAAFSAVLVVLAIAVLLRIPPSFYVFGAQDQGVYVNTAAHYVAFGTPAIHDPLIELAHTGGASDRQALAPMLRGYAVFTQRRAIKRRFEGWREPGFYLADGSRGLVVPQFYLLHPMWLALFWFVFGAAGSMYALTVFSLFALISVYFLCRELFLSRFVGALAAAFLAVNLLQVWVNRYPVSETVAQCWLLAGLWLYLRWRRTDSPGEMWLSAASFGLYAFARLPASFFIPIYVVAFWLDRDERRHYLYYNLLLGFQIAAIAFSTAFSFPYIHDVLSRYHTNYPFHWWEAMGMGAVLIALANIVKWSGKPLWDRLGDGLVRHRVWLFGFAAALGALAVAARCVLSGKAAIAGLLHWSDPASRLVQFSWYLTGVGLIAALVGLYLAFRCALTSRRHLLPMGLLLAMPLFHLAALGTNGYQFYYGRYYVSEALPIAIVGIAFLIYSLVRESTPASRAAGAAVGLGLAICYVLPYSYNHAVRARELDGAYSVVKDVARRLPEGSVTFVAGGHTVEVATGLQHVASRYALPLEYGSFTPEIVPVLDTDAFSRVGKWLLDRGVAVYVLYYSAPNPVKLGIGDLTCIPKARGKATIIRSEHAMRVPRDVTESEDPWVLLQARPRWRGESIFMPVGFIVGKGIYPDVGFTWTDGNAVFDKVMTPADVPLALTLDLSRRFPPQVNPRVQVIVNDRALFDSIVPGKTLHEAGEIGPIRIPVEMNRAPLTVRVTSDTWSPVSLGINPSDSRRLSLDLVGLKFSEIGGGS